MFRTTLKSLAAHKLRLALTAVAIVLGVAFMAGTFVLTDTIKHTFDALFQQTATGKDVVVRAVAPYGTSQGRGGNGEVRPPVPASVVGTIRSVPGVRDAVGSVMGRVTLVGKDGKAVKKQAPVFGSDWSPDRSLSALTISSGRAPQTADEIVMDRATAATEHFALGDRVTVITTQPPRPFTLVGTTKFGTTDNLAGATLISFTTATAQELAGKPGFFDEIDVAAKVGAPADAVLTAVGRSLPPGVEAISGSAAAAQQAKSVESFLTYFNLFLLIFAGIALFVGAFLIANTFSILIGQRTRELALLRAVGASRAQVIRSLIGESLATGIIGSLLGLALGVPLSAGLYALLKAGGLGLPSSTLQVLPRTVYVSVLAGTLITLVASVGPAVRASRIPPVAAMREDAALVETSLRRRAIVGGTFGVVGLAALAAGLFGGVGSTVLVVVLGAALTFVGVATLAPFVAGGMARVIGSPLPVVSGITGRLGQANAARNPRRTAATASALMVGLAVVATIATLGSSLTASFSAIVDRSLRADYVLSASYEGFPRSVEGRARAAPGVVAMSPYTEIDFHEGGARKRAAGIDPVAGPQVFNLMMVTGSVDTLARGGLLVDEKVAHDRHLRIGDVIPMGFTATGVKPLAIGGTYKTNQFLDNYLLGYDVIAANTTNVSDEAVFIKTAARTPATLSGLSAAVGQYPNVTVKTAAQYRNDQKKRFSSFLLIVYVLLALSIIIAAFSVVNTMALSVIERTREIGLLRSIGMARRQVRAMVRGEAVIVSLLGAVLGLILGVGLGSAIVTAIGRTGTGLDALVIPVPTVIVVLVLAALIGVVAAVFPARRAARLDVLRAIATA